MTYRLAQINIARMVAPLDSPVMKDFVDNLDSINLLAEESAGFVWRLKDNGNNATSLRAFEDANLIVNMSVWETMESLSAYVYKSGHVEIFKRRREWFHKMDTGYMALWYVPAGEYPSVQDGIERINHIDTHGETPYAFTFRRRFMPEDAMISK